MAQGARREVETHYKDATLQKQYREAVLRGDFDVLSCCGHIRHAHKDEWCRQCWATGKKCPGGAK